MIDELNLIHIYLGKSYSNKSSKIFSIFLECDTCKIENVPLFSCLYLYDYFLCQIRMSHMVILNKDYKLNLA